MAQTISPIIFNWIGGKIGVFANPALYGPLITGAVGITYLGSIPFWYKAGKAYKELDRKSVV